MNAELIRQRIQINEDAENAIGLVQAGHDPRRLDAGSFTVALAALRKEREQLQGSFFFRLTPSAAEVGRLGDAPASFTPDSWYELPAMRALLAALMTPRHYIDLAKFIPPVHGKPLCANTARSRIDTIVQRLEAICPGIGTLLASNRAARRGGAGISVFMHEKRVCLVYSPTPGRRIEVL